MSKMYGNRRVVLNNTPTHWGNRLVCICGGGLYAPLGFWYKEGGLYWVDLKSRDQWYDEVSKDTIANKGFGGFPTKQALRDYVMEYWNQKAETEANRISEQWNAGSHVKQE